MKREELQGDGRCWDSSALTGQTLVFGSEDSAAFYEDVKARSTGHVVPSAKLYEQAPSESASRPERLLCSLIVAGAESRDVVGQAQAPRLQ